MSLHKDRWKPSVTVAAVIERDGRYLLVEEHTARGLRLNNPAGHLEPGESPEQGTVREVLEETARSFTPEALVGVYLARFTRPEAGEDVTYLRFTYCGTASEELPGHVLDEGIVRTLWLSLDEVRAAGTRLRSDLVLQCIEDHAAGRRLPLHTVTADPSIYQPPEHGR